LGFVFKIDLIPFSIFSWLKSFCLLFRNTGQSYCEVQTVQQSRPAAVLASIEDLSLSIDSQHTHLDITSQLGTQVWHGFSLHNFLSFNIFSTHLQLLSPEAIQPKTSYVSFILFEKLRVWLDNLSPFQ
jgi:hypothetical protein